MTCNSFIYREFKIFVGHMVCISAVSPLLNRQRQRDDLCLWSRLVACLLNISEARDKDVVEKVAQAAITHQHACPACFYFIFLSEIRKKTKGTAVLNIFSDHDYNRSVLTIVAAVELIGEAVLAASERAFSLIDMMEHEGIHPCMGAVDLVPFYPLGEEVSLEDCGKEAQAFGAALTERVPGTGAFFFGWADEPLRRGLAHRRKELGWFRKATDMTAVQPDVGGPPMKRCGLTGIGASSYVMNCNVTIDTQDVSLGRGIAAAIRESSPGGIAGVQVISLPHEGSVEIACNVESVSGSDAGRDSWPSFRIGDQKFCHAPASLITTRVEELARFQGVTTRGTALVGFTPLECKSLAERALTQDIGAFWKELHGVRM